MKWLLMTLLWGAALAVGLGAYRNCRRVDVTPDDVTRGPAPGHEHDHHRQARAHRDPGPRLISFRARMAERAESYSALGPNDPIGVEGVEAATGDKYVVLPDGRQIFGAEWRRKRDDVMSPLEVIAKRPDIVGRLHEGMDHGAHNRCAAEFRARYPHPVQLSWSLFLHLRGRRGGTLVIDDVESPDWPELLDQQARDCYVAEFRGVEVNDWPLEETLTVEYPVCLNSTPITSVREWAALWTKNMGR